MSLNKHWNIRTSSVDCQARDVGCCSDHRRMKDAKFGIPHIKCSQENCPTKIPIDKMLEFFKELVYDRFLKEGNWSELDNPHFINSEAEELLTKFIDKCQEGQAKWVI